jgi:hypothetical protein
MWHVCALPTGAEVPAISFEQEISKCVTAPPYLANSGHPSRVMTVHMTMRALGIGAISLPGEIMTATAPSSGTTAEYARLAQATGRAEDDLFESNPWYEWGSLPLRVLGAPYGRTTATAATPEVSFPMIMPDLGRIDGTKTAWRACRTFTMICVWPWHFGMASIRS